MEPSYDANVLRKEQAPKEQCIEISSLKQEADYRKLEHFEQIIFRQSKEMLELKQEYNRNVKQISDVNQIYSELLEKYERAVDTVKTYQEKEAMCINKIEDIKMQAVVLKAKREFLEKRANEDCEQLIKTSKQQSEEHAREIAKLESTVKTLEIKIASLETMLKLRSDEFSALKALRGDTAIVD